MRLHNVSIHRNFGNGIKEFISDVEELTLFIRTFDQIVFKILSWSFEKWIL